MSQRTDPGGPLEPAEASRWTLAVVALDSTAEVAVVRAALGELGLDPDGLDADDVSALVRVVGTHVELVDPRQRAAIVSATPVGDRRRIHRALAHVTTEPRHRVQHAEHLASAAAGRDQEAADAIADLAGDAGSRGDTAAAGELFLRAGGLAPDPKDRALHLYHAGDAYWNAGEYTAARAAFDAAYVGSSEPILRADVAWQLGQLDMYQRGPRHARDLFVAAAAAVEPYDGNRAAKLLAHAASTSMLSSDIVGCLAHARRAATLAEQGDGSETIAATLMLAFLSLMCGDVGEFDARFPPLAELADQLKDADIAEADLFFQVVAMIHVYNEHWDTGRVYLESLAHRAGRRARFATAALASATLAELCWRSGRWDEAWTLTTSDLVTQVTLTGARLWLLAFTAHLDAGFGRADECRARAQAALAESVPMGFGTAVVWAYHALGLLELGLGHAVAAAAHLDRLAAMATAYEMVEPGGLWWQADHVEALARSGRTHEAMTALVRFEAGAAASHGVWGQATSARCRGLLARSNDDAERSFATSLEHHERLAAPFELGRTLLCRAERRLATRSPLGPSADLAEALAIFDALGATSWSAQARALFGTLGAGAETAELEQLSKAEHRVAEAVAEGMTNREVAARLFVSEKTVEFHLHNVYAKLGIHSRTQLVRRFPRPETDAAS